MADDGGTGEKTEEPTPQKLRQAREKGQVAKSQDIIQATAFVGVFSVLGLSIGWIASSLMSFMTNAFSTGSRYPSTISIAHVMEDGLWTMLAVIAPALGAAFVFGVVGNYLQIGFLFTAEPLKPDPKKLNPFTGAKNLFSKKKLVEALKQILKFLLVSYVAYTALKSARREIILTARMDLYSILAVGGRVIFDIVVRVGGLFFVIAAADFFWQRHVFKKDMMMSKYDIKQEYKQSEGDPQMKSERKALAQELIMQGSSENVAKADAVITNPAHIAVAIKYDEESGGAPKIVAKGLRKNAERIKEIARHNNVPIMRNIPLAQALNELDLDEEIPEELYEAVAEVLNFIYEMKESGKI